jgi:hypothetical protein
MIFVNMRLIIFGTMYAVYTNKIRRSASEILFRKLRDNGISCHPIPTLLKNHVIAKGFQRL